MKSRVRLVVTSKEYTLTQVIEMIAACGDLHIERVEGDTFTQKEGDCDPVATEDTDDYRPWDQA